MTTLRDIEKRRTVRIFHNDCGEAWFWAVDTPETAQDIGEAITRGIKRGDRVEFFDPDADTTVGFCKCPKEALG